MSLIALRAPKQPNTQGRWLGLFLTKAIIEAHGGNIWIDPEAARRALSLSLPQERRFSV
jgi:signal transduction histidine kinase